MTDRTPQATVTDVLIAACSLSVVAVLWSMAAIGWCLIALFKIVEWIVRVVIS